MAATVIATVLANIVGNATAPSDIESDSLTAADGTLNIRVKDTAGNAGFITLDPIAASVLASVSNGPCSCVIIQGAGVSSVTTTQ